jgi:hypothetical protein
MDVNVVPRLFNPPITITNRNESFDYTLVMLKNVINKQQDIIDKQEKMILDHETKIKDLQNNVSNLEQIIKGRQFMRSVSFEDLTNSD